MTNDVKKNRRVPKRNDDDRFNSIYSDTTANLSLDWLDPYFEDDRDLVMGRNYRETEACCF